LIQIPFGTTKLGTPDFQYFEFYGVMGVAAVLGVAEASVSV